MPAIIVLLILVPLIIITILLIINVKVSTNQETLQHLQKQLDSLTRQLRELGKEVPADKKTEQSPITFTPPVEEVTKQPLPEAHTDIKEKITVTPPVQSIPEDIDERKYREKESWMEKNPDLEKFIGENLINKIGIAILVLGISFFVKYAIDKNWINESGRVIIGLVSGGILIGLAHYIRNSYRSFSSVLVGGGLTVFYFTIAFAFHEYHLISQQSAFIIMVLISAFAVALSLYYNRQELAVLATIGGFITPFLVTTGQDNYIALFTYLCILNSGLMVLSWFKRWPSINMIALFFTTFIYGGWLIKRTIFEEADTLPYKDALLFASLFYILFVVMNIINSLRMKRKFTAFDFIVVLSINFLYYTAGITALTHHTPANYKGLFTIFLGIINLLLVIIFYRKKNIDRNFVSLLTGLALLFISLAAPVQLKGNYVVLFWAAESVVLFWLYQRSRIIHLRFASLIVCLLMLLSLVINWAGFYLQNNGIVAIIINKGFITSIAASVSLFIYYSLMRKENEQAYTTGVSNQQVKQFLLIAAVITAYLAGALEIHYQFLTRFPETDIYAVYLQAYSFAVAILVLQLFKRSASYSLLKFLLTTLCLGFYLFNLNINYQVSSSLVIKGEGMLFSAHWLASVLLLWLLYDLVRFFFQEKNTGWAVYRSSFSWIATASMVFVLSVEMYHVILWTNYRNQDDWAWWQNLYYKAGLTILWSICSFIMMWLGMKFSFRTLRIISLSLFSITLVKLFGYDIRDIPPGGKIAAFILLGVLLLTVSFMYQRLKKMIIEDNEKAN